MKWLETLPRVFAASDFVARSCMQQPELLSDLISSGDLLRSYPSGELAARITTAVAEVADEAALKTRLRQLRRREMVRIAWRDLAGWADLNETMATLSEFADACVDGALAKLHAWAVEKNGEPRGEHGGKPQRLVVLGLGKLGGQELNFSSDIDLIFAYPEDGETQSERALSNHEFFIRLGQSLINVLNENTADGFVFRVDMRLRPNGASGPHGAFLRRDGVLLPDARARLGALRLHQGAGDCRRSRGRRGTAEDTASRSCTASISTTERSNRFAA